MRTFTILAAAVLVTAIAGFASDKASAQGGGGAPFCSLHEHWDQNSGSCVSGRVTDRPAIN
jgi:hypothetical protein